MPLVAFALKEELKLPFTVFEIQDKLRERYNSIQDISHMSVRACAIDCLSSFFSLILQFKLKRLFL